MCSLYNSWIIFLTGLLGVWKAIPVGLALGCNAFTIILMTGTGALLAIVIIYLLGSRVKKWILKRLDKGKSEKKKGKLNSLLEKYGIPGMGILGTLLLGPNMTMAMGMIIVKKEKALLLWTAVGIVIWTVVLTFIGTYSVELFQELA
jgi:membrane protein DedA with SNARE-associated domain